MSDKKINRIWALSLMILSVLSLIIGITVIADFEIPHTLRMIIAVIQVIVGVIVIVTSVLKLKATKK